MGVTRGAGVPVSTLTALVLGALLNAAVFSLPSRFAEVSGVTGTLVGYAVAGAGTAALVLVFRGLAVRRPDLDGAVYAYARAGFGEYVGTFAVFGYWASVCVGSVTYWLLATATLGTVLPALAGGATPAATAVSSVGVWSCFLLVRNGTGRAAAVNRVVTAVKVVPIVVFLVLAAVSFQPDVFTDNLGGADYTGTMPHQVRSATSVLVFVFLGVEAAAVFSRHARRRTDIGRATVLGFLAGFVLLAAVPILSYGLLSMNRIATLRQPSMGGVLESAVGRWGAAFVGVALVLAVLGAYLAWTLLATEVLSVAADRGGLPRVLCRTNAAGTPTGALLATTVLVQGMLVVTAVSGDAFSAAFDLTSALTLVPFLLVAGFAVRLAVTGAEPARGRLRDGVVGALAA
ncbi:amino acid permease [Actinocatenispora rupis]|uniref:Amino acid APC transporter n=1 Tax=Actinocatenispora rupis TaxID=519421 RepID=A0A8J3N9U5_9ACTN|nr:amino acid permease [Actinocatenispora rupis]GID11421.1 amino acid APC transporter [Actinocatenispora rupis]